MSLISYKESMVGIDWHLHGDGNLAVWLDGKLGDDNTTEISIPRAVAYLARNDDEEDISQLRGVLIACVAMLDDSLQANYEREMYEEKNKKKQVIAGDEHENADQYT